MWRYFRHYTLPIVIASFSLSFLKIQNDMIKISDTEYFSNDKTIRFLNMDCNVFMAGCKENEFDLIHNDPPYRNENKPTKWMKEK